MGPGMQPERRRRYDEANPRVTVRLTASLRKILDDLRKEEGLSYADLIKRGLMAAADEDAAYQKGRNDAKREPVAIGVCSRCGKPLLWRLTTEKDRLLLAGAVNAQLFFHHECKASKD